MAGRAGRAALALVLLALHSPAAALTAQGMPADSSGTAGVALDGLLDAYNANIRLTMDSIDTLRVMQEMVEPTSEGGRKGALAVLRYRRGEKMERDELSSDLGHPVGEYSLKSLVGPELLSDEYDVRLTGTEEMEGRTCHRLEVTATKRDSDHFDGSVWVEVGSLGLVRIVGEVADAPFPVRTVTLDKAFEPVPEGPRLLRRHTGEIDIQAAFVRRHGVMHIFYTDYEISLTQQPAR
jgi:hypothetical protein